MTPTETEKPSTEIQYYLGSDYVASHYLWRDMLGYYIHPKIPTGGKDLRIADIATGTGIWAFDVSKTLRAGTALECFDVTPAKFPRPFADPSLRLRPDRARRATSLTPLTVRWIDRLHDTFAAHRLAVAAADRPAPKPWQQSMFTQQFLILANEMAGAVYDRDPASGRGAELRRLAQEADEEMRGGSCKRQDARVVVGRKAA